MKNLFAYGSFYSNQHQNDFRSYNLYKFPHKNKKSPPKRKTVRGKPTVFLMEEIIQCNGADYEARTRYLHLGKVALYQMSYGRISGAFIPAPSRAILANFGAPAKACGARFCGEKEKIWYSSQKSCLQDFPMNDRIFDVVPPIGIEPMTRGFSVPCSTD